jgi:transposase
MDTNAVATQVGSEPVSVRRRGSYRKRTVEEKRRIVEESLAAGTSIAKLARRHDMNANQLFTWRKQYAQGELGPVSMPGTASLLSVRVDEPRPKRAAAAPSVCAAAAGWIEIECSASYRVRLHGAVDRVALSAVLEVLSAR